MSKKLLLKGSVIAITISLLLVSTFFAGSAVNSYASSSSQNTQAEVAYAYGPCWRCGTGW